MGSPFVVATTPIPAPSGCGRYEGVIDESWTLVPLPQGGVVTAAAVRAMGAELNDDRQSLRSLHTTFVAPVSHGAVDISVEVLRRGRSMSHLRAEVRNRAATTRGAWSPTPPRSASSASHDPMALQGVISNYSANNEESCSVR